MQEGLIQDIGYIEGIEGQQPYQPPPQQPYYPPQQQYQPPPYQPYAYGPPPGPQMGPYGPPAKPETAKPLVAGILLILAGIEGLALGGILAVLGGTFAAAFGGLPGGGPLAGIIIVCGVILMIFGILALLGGIMSATRKNWSMALIGSIFGLFCLGFVIFEASIMSFIALILIALSKDEF